jgi:hypothetical protein
MTYTSDQLAAFAKVDARIASTQAKIARAEAKIAKAERAIAKAAPHTTPWYNACADVITAGNRLASLRICLASDTQALAWWKRAA